jgi:hypothetical protein
MITGEEHPKITILFIGFIGASTKASKKPKMCESTWAFLREET